MADNPKYVLPWQIDNATVTFAIGKVESAEFSKGGFRWTAGVERCAKDVKFTLRCDSDHNGPWKCEAELDVFALQNIGGFSHCVTKERFCFDEKKCQWQNNVADLWRNFYLTNFINNKVNLEFRIKISSSEKNEPIPEPSKFAAPSSMSNVILKIGEDKLHVSKEYLAVHSPVFKTLFFGDFAEKGKEEVELKDVVYEEFLDLLNLLYFHTTEITDRTVPYILKLADRFQMERFIELSTKHLIQSCGFDVAKKLSFADQYRLVSLRDHCFKSFTNAADMISKLKSAREEFANLSIDMKAAISERIIEF